MKQHRTPFKKISTKELNILNLEKEYFDTLYKIFSSQKFSNELEKLKNNINYLYSHTKQNHDKANIVDIPLERLINKNIYSDKKLNIIEGYASPVSSDTAFVTKNAVINIDSKTISAGGNKEDWKRQLAGCNQTSFENKNFSSGRKNNPCPITFKLQKEYKNLPVLSYFLSFFYFDNGVNLEWYDCKNNPLGLKNSAMYKKNIKFSCVPNGKLSKFFDFDLVSGIKDYDPANVPNPIGTKSVRIDHDDLSDRWDGSSSWIGFKSWVI
tara:strand:+ start:3333 stop:4133 length:801 start_codon:yes stop_codon:yes gene_type:complete